MKMSALSWDVRSFCSNLSSFYEDVRSFLRVVRSFISAEYLYKKQKVSPPIAWLEDPHFLHLFQLI